MIPTLNLWADTFAKAMGAVLWQSALLVALAALLAWALRRASPVVRYWLWQIVAIKLLLMPFWTFAVPMPSWSISKPVVQTAAIHSTTEPSNETGQVTLPPRIPLMGSPPTDTAPRAPSLWESLMNITWQAWLLLVWFAVVLGQIARLLAQRFRLGALLNGVAVPTLLPSPASGEGPGVRASCKGISTDEDLTGLVCELSHQIGLRRVPTVVMVDGDCPLFVCGIWWPRLVLPCRLMASLGPAERRQVVLHELAHIKRHDLPWGWPVEIARIVYFFNPLVYWVAYRLRLERELACDQLAMARSGHSAADYAQTLVQVVTHASEPVILQPAAIAAGVTGSERSK